MIFTKRFEWYHGPIFNYRIKWYAKPNPIDNNKHWMYEESWFVGVQLSDKWKLFIKEAFYYDGHVTQAITILGIRFIKGYGWQAERLV